MALRFTTNAMVPNVPRWLSALEFMQRLPAAVSRPIARSHDRATAQPHHRTLRFRGDGAEQPSARSRQPGAAPCVPVYTA